MNTVLALAGVVIKELYRRKDFYVLLVLTVVITVATASINFFNDTRIVRFVKEICLLLIWISSLVVAIGTAARQIPAERENRTIFPLLAKPVTRWQVILGKFAGCWVACGIALVTFYLFFGVLSEVRGRSEAPAAVGAAAKTGASDHDDHKPETAGGNAQAHEEHQHTAQCQHGEQETASTVYQVGSNYLQALWMHWLMLGIVTAMVLFGSVIFAAPSSNSTITFIGVGGILFLGEHLNKIALRQSQPMQVLLQVAYFLIPHLEWFYNLRTSLIYDRAPLAWWVCGLATLYAAAYMALFLFLAWLVFRRKTLTL